MQCKGETPRMRNTSGYKEHT